MIPPLLFARHFPPGVLERAIDRRDAVNACQPEAWRVCDGTAVGVVVANQMFLALGEDAARKLAVWCSRHGIDPESALSALMQLRLAT